MAVRRVVDNFNIADGAVLDQYFGWQANFWLLFIAGGAIAWLLS